MLRTNYGLLEAIGRQVIDLESEALRQLAVTINGDFSRAVVEILGCKQRIIVSGIGKSGHIARKIAATLAATGTPAHFVHASEAAHGDAGMVMQGDLVLLLSNSGQTAELLPLCLHTKRIGCKLVCISSNPDALLTRMADLALVLPTVPEACSVSMAPTTSASMMLALGDALALTTMRSRGLSHGDIRALHPGGEIGLRLRCVADVMHKDEQLPLVAVDAPIADVLLMMTAKRLGMTGVVDADNSLVGVITDGDLRRRAPALETGTAADFMSPDPKIVDRSTLLDDALALMTQHRITVLFVADAAHPGRTIGAVQIYDIALAPRSDH